MVQTYFSFVRLVALLGIFPLGSSLAQSPVSIDFRLKATTPASAQPTLRVDSSLVLVPTHVTDARGASLTNLQKENFHLFEGNLEQTIASFSKDDAPVSVGLLFDMSASMRTKMQTASEAVASFFRTSNEADEFFLVKFSDKATLAVPFTTTSGELYNKILRIRPWGRTSLLDAIDLALRQMKRARNGRKAIVILSDGGDNWSRHNVREIRSALLESDVQVYAMGIFDQNDLVNSPAEERNGPRLLDDIAEQSGGRHYRVDNLNDLPAISAKIGNELRSQYLLGYHPINFSRDGKYHQIRIELAAPGARPDFRTYYRRGYYAPLQ